MMKCPSCGVALPEGSAECPSCGANFERWKKRAAQKAEELKREKIAALAALKTGLPEMEKATDFDPLLGRKIAAAVILIWLFCGGLFLSCHQPAARRRRPRPPVPDPALSTAAVSGADAEAPSQDAEPEPEPENE